MAIDNSGLVYLLDPFWQGENLNGKPLVGGYMCVYVAGTDTKYITYQNFDGTRNPFKIPLGSDGRAVIIVEAQFKYDCYLYDSFGNMVCSRLNVSPDVGGDISVSGLTEVYHDGTLEGEGTPWVPLTVSTSAIDEMVSGKADVSALTAYQEITGMTAYQPVGDYYSASNPSGFATTAYVDSGLSGKADTSALDGLMSASLLESDNGVITAYNGSAFAGGGGSTYSGIEPVIVDNENKTISVSAKEFVVNDPLQLVENQSAFELSLTANIDSPRTRIVEYGVDDWDAVESAISDMSAGKIDYVVAKMVEGNDIIYAPLARVNSGEQAVFVSPANIQDTSYGMGTRRVTDVISISTGGNWFDQMIRPFQGKLHGYGSVHVQVTGTDYEISGDTLPTSAQEAIDLVSTNSATWDTVSSKQPSGDYYSASNPSGFITGVPTGTMNETGLEYSGSTITGYNGSAIGTSARPSIPVSGASGIKIEDNGSTVVISYSGDTFTGVSHDGSFVGDGKSTPIQLSDEVVISGLLPDLTISAAGRASGYYKPEMVKMHATGSGGDQMGQYGAEGINLTYNGGKYYHTELKTTAGGINIRYLGNTAISADYMNSGLSFTDMTGTESAGARDIARWNSTYNTVSDNSANWTGGVDTTAVSAIASEYAESAISSVSGNYYPMNSNPSGYLTGIPARLEVDELIARTGIISEGNILAPTIDAKEPVNPGDSDYYGVGLSVNGIEITDNMLNTETITYNSITGWNSTMNTVSSNSAAWAQGGVDSATVSAIASSYAESAASGKLDTTAFNSAEFYTTANESGFITGIPDPLTVNELYTNSIQLTAQTAGESNPHGVWIDTAGISIVATDDAGNAFIDVTAVTNWDSTYETVYNNSASWTDGGAGGDVYVSGFEYTTGGDISGYSGSAFVGNEETFEISAGYGISLTTGADSLTISNTMTIETGSI